MSRPNEKTYCRWSPSLGALSCGMDAESVWGTPPYRWRHRNGPCVFFGMYDLRDYLALAAHRGKAYVLWAGSDLRSLAAGFAFSDGKLAWLSRLTKGRFSKYVIRLLQKAEHWVENEHEAEILRGLGLEVAGIAPSFMGDVSKYRITYAPRERAHVYVSAHPGREEEYGFSTVERIAGFLPHMRFVLYGAEWQTRHDNVIVRGMVNEAVMDEEIKKFQIALRCNKFDGFSEITCKVLLNGGYPLTFIKYPHILHFNGDEELIMRLNELGTMTEPNFEARSYYLKKINDFPWVCHS